MNPAGGMAAMLYQASTWVLPVVFAVTFHEAAHGFVAYQFGDDTAQRAGRVTFNPFKHVDTFGTIILPAMLILLRSPFLFGYAKPVPVNFRRLDRPRRDMVWVALAGPGTNVLLAIVSSLLFYGVGLMPASPAEWLGENLVHSIQINAVLCVFNMLPLPPLDGGDGWRVASRKKITATDGTPKTYAKQVEKAWKDIQKNYPDTPWEVLAYREGLVALGLEWKVKKE